MKAKSRKHWIAAGMVVALAVLVIWGLILPGREEARRSRAVYDSLGKGTTRQEVIARMGHDWKEPAFHIRRWDNSLLPEDEANRATSTIMYPLPGGVDYSFSFDEEDRLMAKRRFD